MPLTRLQMSATLLVAILLHVAVAAWFSLPEPAAKPLLAKPLKINLLASITDISKNVAAEIVEPPEKVKPEPVIEKKPVKPKPIENTLNPEPLIEPLIEPIQPVTQPVVQPVAQPVAQPVPAEAKVMDAVATARYEQLLVAWLEKHKNYPRRAKRLRIEGEGMLRILIDHTGETQQVSLKQSTGNRLLDKAALEMVRQANPFPPMPENDPRQTLEFIVPVAFMLR
jgi:periplasmic protein TonB